MPNSKVEIIKQPVEQVGDRVKQAAWTSVFESLAILIIGILLLIWPNEIKLAIAYIVGTFFVIKGGYQIVTYFMEKGQNDFFNNNLLAGVVSVLVGIAAFLIGDNIANIFRIIVGIFIVYESLVRISTSIKLHAAGISVWKYVLGIALVMLIMGIFVTFNDVATVIGWVMIVAGIIGVIGDIVFIQQVNEVITRLVGKK